MEIRVRKDNSINIVDITGKMDAVTSPEFDRQLNALTSVGENIFLFNLTGLEYISSAGLRSFLTAGKQVKASGGKLCLFGLDGPVKEVFGLSGFNTIFSIFGNETEALAAMR